MSFASGLFSFMGGASTQFREELDLAAQAKAAKAKAEAEKRALEAAAHKKYLADFKDTQKKKVKHTKKLKDWVTTHPIETTASSLVPLGTLKAKEYLDNAYKKIIAISKTIKNEEYKMIIERPQEYIELATIYLKGTS